MTPVVPTAGEWITPVAVRSSVPGQTADDLVHKVTNTTPRTIPSIRMRSVRTPDRLIKGPRPQTLQVGCHGNGPAEAGHYVQTVMALFAGESDKTAAELR